MKNIRYQANLKLTCRKCRFNGIPVIRTITFQNVTNFICTAHCSKCGAYIENLPMNSVKIEGRKGRDIKNV
jgi:hypothetical protein